MAGPRRKVATLAHNVRPLESIAERNHSKRSRFGLAVRPKHTQKRFKRTLVYFDTNTQYVKTEQLQRNVLTYTTTHKENEKHERFRHLVFFSMYIFREIPFVKPQNDDDDDELMLNVLRCHETYSGQVVTNAEARFNKSLRPRKPEGSLGRTAQDVHLDSHTAPEL